jgi:hypothetical protein
MLFLHFKRLERFNGCRAIEAKPSAQRPTYRRETGLKNALNGLKSTCSANLLTS